MTSCEVTLSVYKLMPDGTRQPLTGGDLQVGESYDFTWSKENARFEMIDSHASQNACENAHPVLDLNAS